MSSQENLLTVDLISQHLLHQRHPFLAPAILDHGEGLKDVLIGYCLSAGRVCVVVSAV